MKILSLILNFILPFKKYKNVAEQCIELIMTIVKALEDKKVTIEEIKKIVEESKDVIESISGLKGKLDGK